MVMELLEDRSLAAVLETESRLPVSRAVRLIDQVLSALAAAHKHGIVHRDLKPDNVFIMQTEYQPDFVKLLDFGISKILSSHEAPLVGERRKETLMGTVMGTPEYMSPEQARGLIDQVDARTDLWATGVVLYEALCGRTPFEGDNYNAIMAAIVEGVHPRARALRASVPERIDQVIETCLAWHARRYVLAEVAAHRRQAPALALAAHDALAEHCVAAKLDCTGLLAPAATHVAEPGLTSLNVVLVAYAALVTD